MYQFFFYFGIYTSIGFGLTLIFKWLSEELKYPNNCEVKDWQDYNNIRLHRNSGLFRIFLLWPVLPWYTYIFWIRVKDRDINRSVSMFLHELGEF